MTNSDTPGGFLTAEAARTGSEPARVTAFVRGRVQGVGFRWWTRARALELGLVGHARNMADGRVEVVAQGRDDALQRLVDLLGETPTTTGRPGLVESVVVQRAGPKDGITGFAPR
ncbi:MAG: acylphosphatase [Terracoccus sp.]